MLTGLDQPPGARHRLAGAAIVLGAAGLDLAVAGRALALLEARERGGDARRLARVTGEQGKRRGMVAGVEERLRRFDRVFRAPVGLLLPLPGLDGCRDFSAQLFDTSALTMPATVVSSSSCATTSCAKPMRCAASASKRSAVRK